MQTYASFSRKKRETHALESARMAGFGQNEVGIHYAETPTWTAAKNAQWQEQ
jgi:hypothetical protein